jgi:hypothetical protein
MGSRYRLFAQTFAGSLAVGKDGRLAYHLPAGDGGTSSTTLTETFVDRRGRAVVSVPSGASAQTTQVSYMLGRDKALHRSGLATYGHVALGEVYPGIDVRLRATGTNVEKIFTVAPGVDAGAIKIRLGGAQRMEIGSAGELVAHTVNALSRTRRRWLFSTMVKARAARCRCATRLPAASMASLSARMTAHGRW